MKRLALLSMLLLAASCGRQSAFEDLKAYMASTQQSRVDPEHLADIMSKVCRGDDSIPFLKQKLTSSDDPRDAVAAYLNLFIEMDVAQWPTLEKMLASDSRLCLAPQKSAA